MADAEADRHDGVTSGPCPRYRGGDPPEVSGSLLPMSHVTSHSPVPVVSLTQLTKLIIAPAPGLASLIHHQHVGRLLAAAHKLDPHVLELLDPLGLVNIVL